MGADLCQCVSKLVDGVVGDRDRAVPPGALDTSAFLNQIFTAVNFQVTQQDAAAQAEGNIALNLILLYRALGGGWQIRLKDGQCPAPGPGPPDVPPPGAPAPAQEPADELLPPPRPVSRSGPAAAAS